MGACLNKGKNIVIKSNKKRKSSSSLEYEINKNNKKEISLTTLSSNDISDEINLKDINSIDSIINNNTVKEIIDIFHI